MWLNDDVRIVVVAVSSGVCRRFFRSVFFFFCSSTTTIKCEIDPNNTARCLTIFHIMKLFHRTLNIDDRLSYSANFAKTIPILVVFSRFVYPSASCPYCDVLLISKHIIFPQNVLRSCLGSTCHHKGGLCCETCWHIRTYLAQNALYLPSAPVVLRFKISIVRWSSPGCIQYLYKEILVI